MCYVVTFALAYAVEHFLESIEFKLRSSLHVQHNVLIQKTLNVGTETMSQGGFKLMFSFSLPISFWSWSPLNQGYTF